MWRLLLIIMISAVEGNLVIKFDFEHMEKGQLDAGFPPEFDALVINAGHSLGEHASPG